MRLGVLAGWVCGRLYTEDGKAFWDMVCYRAQQESEFCSDMWCGDVALASTYLWLFSIALVANFLWISEGLIWDHLHLLGLSRIGNCRTSAVLHHTYKFRDSGVGQNEHKWKGKRVLFMFKSFDSLLGSAGGDRFPRKQVYENLFHKKSFLCLDNNSPCHCYFG